MLLNQLANLPRQIQIMKQYYLVYARKSTEGEESQIQSIDDQRNILTSLAKEKKLPILQIFEEEKSAKSPGRPVFNQMMALISSRNDIKGIISWKLNRLSRNPIDSGQLQWLIQSGKIDEIVTPAKTYLDADSDFIMSIEGAQANKFIRDLREDTIRGINSKIEKGWKPGAAPAGYRNTVERPKGLREIVPHPVYSPLVRKIFDFALTGQYSLDGLGLEAQRLGIVDYQGKIKGKKNIWKMLSNPFYTGRFLYKGQLYIGKHQRMITDAEFDLIQKFLAKRSKPRNNEYPTSGLIRCSCGYMIAGTTSKRRYLNGEVANFVFYRCSQRKIKCNEPPINQKDLNEQIVSFLSSIKLSPRLVTWAIKELNKSSKDQIQTKQAKIQALNQNLDVVNKKLQNLFNLKIHPDNINGSLITDDEYKRMRQTLLVDKDKIDQELLRTDSLIDDWMDVAIRVFNFASKALEKWENGTIEEKRIILNAVGAELVLSNRRLDITPRSMFKNIQTSLASKGSNIERSVHRVGVEPTWYRFTVCCMNRSATCG